VSHPIFQKGKTMDKVQNGQTVSVHYRGTFDDGTEFDSSHTREQELSFQVGAGQMISGFDSALSGMTVGETKKIRLEATEAYGEINLNAIQEVSRTAFPEDFEFVTGVQVSGQTDQGQPVTGQIREFGDETVTVDFNHPMAGKPLNFEIELMSIQKQKI
tara:strand:+ start:182 stop:658 length:477 start_codon:yes stop_codon:yes gene_type:complete